MEAKDRGEFRTVEEDEVISPANARWRANEGLWSAVEGIGDKVLVEPPNEDWWICRVEDDEGVSSGRVYRVDDEDVSSWEYDWDGGGGGGIREE